MIKVQSLIQDRNSLVPVEVELALWPGLPGIQFLGLPDQHLKESSMRIKSAIKHAGFQFPVAQQILVNLRPSHLKKTSRGLELAVAAAYLWETGQVQKPVSSSDFFIYGELSLAGEVIEPEDLASSFQLPHSIVLTGKKPLRTAPFRRQVISHLRELESPQEISAERVLESAVRPREWIEKSFSNHQARLLEILAVGEHSLLVAGPAGSGKSTVAQALPGFLKEPSPEELADLQKIHAHFGQKILWRPVVKPHHSTPIIAMVGGGSVPFAGEISRAHGGVLILDELLEFKSAVQEALREPFEEGKMRVFRNGQLKEYPAQTQILATTNLCPCGNWTPLNPESKNCRISMVKCRSYGPRLSGPLLDRFEILDFTSGIGDISEVSGRQLLEKIKQAQEFSKLRSKSPLPNSRLSSVDLLAGFTSLEMKKMGFDEQVSHRRKLAVARVSRTLADLDLSEKIRNHHIDEAVQKCLNSFQRLKVWE